MLIYRLHSKVSRALATVVVKLFKLNVGLKRKQLNEDEHLADSMQHSAWMALQKQRILTNILSIKVKSSF